MEGLLRLYWRGSNEVEWTDEEAVARALDDEPEAFGVLVRRYQGMVYRLLARLTGSAQDAEDLAQEVFLRAYRQLPHLRAPGAFRPWLLRAARNRAIDHARAARSSRRAPPGGMLSLSGDAEGPRGEGDPAEDAIRAEEVAMVRDAVARLPLADREVIHLKYVEGLTVPDIARVLGLGPRTVETRLYRARRRLGDLLGEMGYRGR
ncbi:MAG: sigma-70 family RNA polymerase sigma factor [Bacillota bacterium]|nr:sigma-70 family RNA polymerase sigma factor [Bacillota bacterium]